MEPKRDEEEARVGNSQHRFITSDLACQVIIISNTEDCQFRMTVICACNQMGYTQVSKDSHTHQHSGIQAFKHNEQKFHNIYKWNPERLRLNQLQSTSQHVQSLRNMKRVSISLRETIQANHVMTLLSHLPSKYHWDILSSIEHQTCLIKTGSSSSYYKSYCKAIAS